MNRLSSFLAVVFCCVLTACGGGGGGGDASTQSASTTESNTTVTLSSTQAYHAVGETLTIIWSNDQNQSCSGSGLLSGTLAASGTQAVTLTTEGAASYGVSCGNGSQTASFTVLPQYTKINDPVFEQALVNAGIDDVVDGQILTSKALAVTKLAILSGQGYTTAPDVVTVATGSSFITDTTGLEAFRNLVSLRFEGQKFTQIDLSTLTGLTFVSLWQDPITSIDVSHNTALQTLGISETALTSVDVSALSSLEEIDAQNLQALPYVLSNGTNVQGFAQLDVSKNLKLQRLYASYNRLTSLDLSNNKSLTQADVDHNQLTSLNLDGTIVTNLDTQGNAGLTQIEGSTTMTNTWCASDAQCQIDAFTIFVTGL